MHQNGQFIPRNNMDNGDSGGGGGNGIVVDLQGFKKHHDEFVLKEIAFLEMNEGAEPLTLFFGPPIAWNHLPAKYKAMNSWLVRNFHAVPWGFGDIPYEAIRTTIPAILRNYQTIYVKGLEKKEWLQKFINSPPAQCIIDVQTLDCPSLRKLLKFSSPHSECLIHPLDSKWNCANTNVKSLRHWLDVNGVGGNCRNV